MRVLPWLVFSIACVLPAQAQPAPEVLLLEDFPRCMERRLGPVTANVGTVEPSLNTGMRPPSVAYSRVFRQLQRAALERGGDAVVLRGHRADYFSKDSRVPKRPTYIELQGTAIVLRDERPGCRLALLDPAVFEQRARDKPRSESTVNHGTVI